MNDYDVDLAWISGLDKVNDIWSVQTRDQQFYQKGRMFQIPQHTDGYTALINIDGDRLISVTDVELLQLPGEVVRAHFAWRLPDQLEEQGMFLHKAASMEDPILKEFLIAVLSDAKVMQFFYEARASQNFHHNGKGELFKHSVQVARTAFHLAHRHNLEQREVECAFVCGFLHDIGKLLMFYNTDKNQQKGVNGQHEDFNFMILAEQLKTLNNKDKALFEAVSATLTATTARKKNNEYIVETIVRAADRISAEVYEHQAVFNGKPASQLRVGSKSGKRYKRLGVSNG